MSADTVAFVAALAWRLPALRPVLAEHLKDQEGEVLSHLHMGDYARWAEDAYEHSRPMLATLLAKLEAGFATGNPEVQELIAVSFLEHLPRDDEPRGGISDLLGPSLRAELAGGPEGAGSSVEP